MNEIELLIDGFVYFLSNTVFGSGLLFMFIFIILIGAILLISKCSFEQIFIFMLIPIYSAKDTLLTGVMGYSLLAIFGFINGYFLYTHISKFLSR